MSDKQEKQYSSMSTSSSSSTSEEIVRRKRYKQYLYHSFQPQNVTAQTRKKYQLHFNQLEAKILSEQQLQKDSSKYSDTEIQSNIKSDTEFENSLISDPDAIESSMKSDSEIYEGSIINERHSQLSSPNFPLRESISNTDKTASHSVQSFDDSESENDDFSFDNHSFDSETFSDSDVESGNSDSESEDLTRFDSIMFHQSNLTVRDIIFLTTAFCLRFNVSDEAHLALISILKVCAGPEFQHLNLSKYRMNQCFSRQDEKVVYHYYCSQCSEKIIYSVNATQKVKTHLALCENCKIEKSITSKSPNYFISIDIEYQLIQLFSNDDIFKDILKNIKLQSSSAVNSTLSQGSIHINIMESQSLVKNEYMLSMNCNTDGAPITKSVKGSFWPLQVNLNSLSPKLKSRYILLAGILIVKKEPKSALMNLYLSKFVEQIQKLYNEGIEIMKDGVKFIFKFCTISWTVDSVCRPVLQNRIQFNGYHGCSWCFQVGEYLSAVRGIRYIIDQESEHRTHEDHLEDVKQITESSEVISVRGVKGYSVLEELPHIDMVWSFPYEYMHGMLLGVVLQMLNLWRNPKCKFHIDKKNMNFVENRYLKVKPTHDLHRLPRSGIIKGATNKQSAAKPKASELKSWLLHFSLPYLKNILNEEALNHFALLVKSFYTLLKDQKLSESDLEECENDLIDFVCKFEDLYGKEQMTFNLHSLLHCVQSVMCTGSLCLNSAFPYESFIYTLKKYVSGPKGMDRQMARKQLQAITFKAKAKTYREVSEETMDFCMKLFMPKRLLQFYEQIDDVTFCGKGTLTNTTFGQCTAYNKCIFGGIVYHTTKYDQQKKTVDSVIQLVTDKFYTIQEILSHNNVCYLRLSVISTYDCDPFPGVRHIKKISKEALITNTICTTINNVKRKVIFVNIGEVKYLSILPNIIEIQ